ncbi:MAG TPA: hypothetical protein VLT86_15160 [Vicinamibacterales bacterium]|nr:hypothetical protein [Vicinamibacterales bacterium]
MKRLFVIPVLMAAAVLAAPVLRADVKMQHKTTLKFGGALGAVINRFGGSTTNEGTVSSVAIKGNRKLEMGPTSGSIIDLGEEKVYNLDPKSKTYRVTTFAELRAAYEKAKADAEKKKAEMKPEEKQEAQPPDKQYEFDADVKETGQHKNMLGYDTREVIVTIIGHEKGKKVEESGGLVLTTDMWLAPKIAAVDEVVQFNLKFIKAVYGEAFAADVQQMASTVVMYPAFQPMSQKMQAENGKLQGTPLLSMTTFDGVKSAEELKEAQQQQQQQNQPTSTGGIGGVLARRMMGNKGQPQQRSNVFTASNEVLQVAPSATADDVAIPAGYKEKK